MTIKNYLRKYWLILSAVVIFVFSISIIFYIIITGLFGISIDILVVLLTVNFSGFGWILKSEHDKVREIERREHEMRLENERLTFETRKQSLEGILLPFTASMSGSKIDDPELIKKLKNAGFQLLIYGSDDVIREFTKFKMLGAKQPPDPIGMLVGFARIIITFRKSTGFPNCNLTEEEILRSFINDYDTVATKVQTYIGEHPRA